MAYFPMYVSLENKNCLVVGGGRIAKRKADTLRSFGGKVTVLAAEFKEEFIECTLIEKSFARDDIKGFFIVVAATNNWQVNEEISKICKEKGIAVNVVDSSANSSFLFGAIEKRGNMVVSVNSGENQPAWSKSVKESIGDYLDEHILRVGTRKSPLALAQTKIVIETIKKVNPKVLCQVVEISTKGDENHKKSLKDFGGKGAFTGELERAILEGRIDLAVHSGKDLPIELGEGLDILAVPRREEANDVLVTQKGYKLYKESVIGTGSVRRARQIPYQTMDIRGNVETRLRKLEQGEYDGVVLALAGLKRLGMEKMEKYAYHILSLQESYPAPCQGIIAIEGKKNSRYLPLLEAINHKETWYSYRAERAVVTRMGLGCHFPIGIYSYLKDNIFYMEVKYLEGTGKLWEFHCPISAFEESLQKFLKEIEGEIK
ncbi:MAG: hydroxymethylbilane synthase [Lachnospiraceae bacterium]|nr:hydroxymethylbilane synthase [Lachnospiraceae bacterium]